MPSGWLEEISDVGWVVYPDGLSPLFTGLMKYETLSHDGREMSKCGGWYSPINCEGYSIKDEYIFLDHSSVRSAVHEVSHVLLYKWRVDQDEFYKPETAFHWYMASNPQEYFACAVEAFLHPVRDNRETNTWWNKWNKEDLAKVNPDLVSYLEMKAGSDLTGRSQCGNIVNTGVICQRNI